MRLHGARGPEWHRRSREQRRALAPTWFEAQYQQKPLDLEGGFFRGLERMTVHEAAPTADQFVKRCRFWDLASTEAQAGADPDWTAGVLLGKHKDGTFWVLDVVRARLGPGTGHGQHRRRVVIRLLHNRGIGPGR